MSTDQKENYGQIDPSFPDEKRYRKDKAGLPFDNSVMNDEDFDDEDQDDKDLAIENSRDDKEDFNEDFDENDLDEDDLDEDDMDDDKREDPRGNLNKVVDSSSLEDEINRDREGIDAINQQRQF
jgi:hypothetical protein